MTAPRCPWCGENHPTVSRPDPVAAVRFEDGTQVVVFTPAGLEVRAFTAEDIDERGMPREKP